MSFNNMQIGEYMDILASKESVPGGGGASAVTGAMAAALGSMVCNLTIGKKKFAKYETELKVMLEKLDTLRRCFLELSNEDAKVFLPLSKAYSIPRDDPNREKIMEAALLAASQVPMNVVKKCGETIEILSELLDKSSALVISDVGVGASFAASAMMSASLNVFINTKSMKDRETAVKIEKEVDAVCDKYLPVSDEVFSEVMRRLRKEE